MCITTVFAGVKAAVFSGEKKSKSRGAAYTQQQQNSAVKTSRPFARMGLYERQHDQTTVQDNSRITPHNLPTILCCIVDMKTKKLIFLIKSADRSRSKSVPLHRQKVKKGTGRYLRSQLPRNATAQVEKRYFGLHRTSRQGYCRIPNLRTIQYQLKSR